MESSFPSLETQLVKTSQRKNDEEPPKPHFTSKCEEIISTLPREMGWNKSNDLCQYERFWYYASFLEGIMSVQDHFQAQQTNIIIASFPKTGTTWLKALTFSIVTRTRFDDSTSPLLKKVPHECIPFLEFDLAEIISKDLEELPLVGTHMPYTFLPRSIVDCGCKIVYIWRDVKDVFVSMWYFVAKQLKSKGVEPLPLEEAIELFCYGVVNYGPYWDHVLGYWKASIEFPERILFLKYEEMRKETPLFVKKLAEFMGYPFTSEEEENGIVQKIIKMCSFESLSNLDVNKNGKHRAETELAVSNNVFFRKGKVGDWQNDLTPEMGARLDGIMEKKLTGSGLLI